MKRIKLNNSVVIGLILLILISTCLSEEIYKRQQPDISLLKNSDKEFLVKNRPRVGLVLSGGGSRGIAHVGVLKVLEENNIPIDLIVGSSIGSVIGGFYCAGYSADEIENITKKVDWNDVFLDDTQRENLFIGQKREKDRYIFNLRFDSLGAYIPSSLTPGQKILTIISDKILNSNYHGVYHFDDLKIPFRSVATDLYSGKRAVLDHGDLARAINASFTVPLLFAPIEWDNMWLVDGGLLSNLPVDVAKNLGMDIIIAVDITSPLRKPEQLSAPWEIADQVTTIMMDPHREAQLELASVVIKPDLSGIASMDFSKIEETVKQGKIAAERMLPQLRSIVYKQENTYENFGYGYHHFQIIEDESEVKWIEGFKELNAPHSETINDQLIRQDIDFIFGSGEYKSVSASLLCTGKDTTLAYYLQRNPAVSEIKFSGNQIIPDSILLSFTDFTFTNGFNTKNFLTATKKIKDHYRSLGYTLMDINNIEYDPVKSSINLTIEEGIIDSIIIDGNTATTDATILREFTLKKDDLFNSSKLRFGIENVYNTNLFKRVSANIEKDENKNILYIKVEEKIYAVLRLGGKADNDRSVQTYFELANENFLGGGNTISFSSRYGQMDRIVQLNFRADRIFRSYFTLSSQGFYSWQLMPYFIRGKKKGEYFERRTGIKFLFGQQIRKLGQMNVELRLENIMDKQYSGQFPYKHNSELRTIAVSSIADNRDKIGFTRKGIYNVWRWESGNEQVLDGQVSYVKAFVNLEGYYTKKNNHNFHIRVLGGLSDRTTPFSEYFRIGGLHDFIGLRDRELSGRQVFKSNFEYRYLLPFKIFSDTYLAVRYDFGAIWEQPDLVLLAKDFFSGYGAWLGVDTVVGPLYIGYGSCSNINESFYISLGFDF